MNKKKLCWTLIFLDWLSALISWGTFYFLRKTLVEKTAFEGGESFVMGLIFVPVIWLIIYFMQGTYYDVRRLYRIKVISLTLFASCVGALFLFFSLLLDDQISGYRSFYQSLLILFALQFALTLIFRWPLVNYIVGQVHTRKSGFRTLLVGGSDKAVTIYKEIIALPRGIGNDIVGFVNINGIDRQLETELPYFGHLRDIEEILENEAIEEVIIALESTEHERLREIIAKIDPGAIKIKIISDMYDILSGSVKMTNIYGALLTEVNTDPMPVWQQLFKRVIDILFSTVAMILLLPVYFILALMVKFSSPGPIFFRQERIGQNGQPFQILKFRTMFVDAEKNGPCLSSAYDSRITSSGKIMRKMRLDEFPQFFNVLMGEMSLVGPRPERQFYIDQIQQVEPQYAQLTKVRPGITSWGQVKFGYAENVDQMLQRMKYDLLYLKNRTLALDFKIMLYTVLIILKGSGK
jgi:exopolysaccharide biosynthesis polyprenyl glycosylphosphotransferase